MTLLILKKEQAGGFRPNYKDNHIKYKQPKDAFEDRDHQIGQKSNTQLQGVPTGNSH